MTVTGSLKVETCRLPGVLVIEPPTIFKDFRGSFVETYNEKLYGEAGIGIHFVQDDTSTSIRHVLRGIHGDTNTHKLASCVYGELYLVIVNCDTESGDFGKWVSFVISDNNHLQILVPPKHGVAHLVMSEVALFNYKQSTYYCRESQFSYRFDDKRFAIEWPVSDPLLSERDSKK